MTIKPGWYDKRPKEPGVERISYSWQKHFFKSPLHARYFKDNPKPPTQAMIDGNAFHSVAYGTPNDVAVIPTDINKRTKAGKVEWSEWQEANEGKYCITMDMAKNIDGMVDALYSHHYARRIMESATVEFEKWGLFNDTGFGTNLPCIVRLDGLDRGIGIISDLKSCTDAGMHAVAREVSKFGLHYQAAFYKYGYRVIEDAEAEFVLIFVEKAPPYGVNTVEVRGEWIEIAERKFAFEMPLFADCIKKDRWPGYPETLSCPDMPKWMKTN